MLAWNCFEMILCKGKRSVKYGNGKASNSRLYSDYLVSVIIKLREKDP